MPKTPEATHHPITRDTPLPGFYPCLTLQLNVTRYQSSGLARMVLVVREPSDGVEVWRTFVDTCEIATVEAETMDAVTAALRTMGWLMTGCITE